MHQQFYQNVTDYLTTINRLTVDMTSQAVKATQDFAMEAWKMHPMKDVFENAAGKKSSK
jgi:hypothetical protein